MCVCVCLFLASGSILFLFTKATRKYYVVWNMLEWVLWAWCSWLRFLHQKSASLSTLRLSPPAPIEVEPEMLFFWLILHTGPPRRRVAVTELSQGFRRWFCAKSAAQSVPPWGRDKVAGKCAHVTPETLPAGRWAEAAR